MKRVYLGWRDVEDLISALIFKLNTPYDAVLGVARGGIIPAGMIAEALGMHNVLTASVLFPDAPGSRTAMGWPRFVHFPSDDQLEGRKVLVIDNLWSQGRTIMSVKGRIETAGGFPEVAVLHWKESRNLFPDTGPEFHAETTDDFIHYPWQRIDDSDYRIKAHPEMPLS